MQKELQNAMHILDAESNRIIRIGGIAYGISTETKQNRERK